MLIRRLFNIHLHTTSKLELMLSSTATWLTSWPDSKLVKQSTVAALIAIQTTSNCSLQMTNIKRNWLLPSQHQSLTALWPSGQWSSSFQGPEPTVSANTTQPYEQWTKALSYTAITLHGGGWYQFILLGDRGMCVRTTCPGLLPGSAPGGSRTSVFTITNTTC